MENTYYAIEKINKLYVVKKVIKRTSATPASPAFRSVEAAQNYADNKCYKIEKIGDLYEIL